MVDWVTLPTSRKGNAKVEDISMFMKDIHAQVKSQIELADAHKRRVLFKGDLVRVIMGKKRHSHGSYMKLNGRRVGPCKVLRTINDNTYEVQLPPHLSISYAFNVLVPYLPKAA